MPPGGPDPNPIELLGCWMRGQFLIEETVVSMPEPWLRTAHEMLCEHYNVSLDTDGVLFLFRRGRNRPLGLLFSGGLASLVLNEYILMSNTPAFQSPAPFAVQ
jgi:hypothetical protein